ncbi:hypothetical protein D3C78_18230 [compost metagenome]
MMRKILVTGVIASMLLTAGVAVNAQAAESDLVTYAKGVSEVVTLHKADDKETIELAVKTVKAKTGIGADGRLLAALNAGDDATLKYKEIVLDILVLPNGKTLIFIEEA